MLKGIDPLLTPQLLQVLAEMGHGDEIIVADATSPQPASASGRTVGASPSIHLPGAGIQRTAQALLSLLPLDAAVSQPIAYMKVCDTPDGYRSRLQRDVIDLIESCGHARGEQCEAIERFAFYDRVRTAFAIVLTSDLQPYGNFLFKKGVIGEALDA